VQACHRWTPHVDWCAKTPLAARLSRVRCYDLPTFCLAWPWRFTPELSDMCGGFLTQVVPHSVGLPEDALDVQPLKHGGGRSSDSGLLIMANRRPTDSGFEPYDAWCGSELFANKGVRLGPHSRDIDAWCQQHCTDYTIAARS
jgi:hypothetical protein